MATPSPRRVFFLRTLGTLAIEGGADASQRSRRALALLALIAADGATGTNRDRVIAFLWPNSDAEHAANSFRQVLHGIRRDLGDETLIYESGRLRLNPAHFTVDLWEFNRAIRDGNLQVADDLYRGPFLDGFAVTGLDELERWAESERQRIHQVVLGAVRQLAARAKEERRLQDAVAHWRRVTTLDPLSTTGALGLLNALAAVGDRAGAMAYGRVYQSLVRSQLEMEPDTEVDHLISVLRMSRSGSGTAPPTNASSVATHADVPAVSAAPSRTSTGEHIAKARGWWRRRAASIGRFARLGVTAKIGIATGVALVLLGSVRLYGRSGGRLAANVVAVVPLTSLNAVDPSVGRAISELLATDVNGAGALRAVVPSSVDAALRATVGDRAASLDRSALHAIARRVGAGLVVTGDVGTSGAETRITLSLRDGRDGSTIGSPVTVDGDSASLLRLVDAAAAQLLAEYYRAPSDQLTSRAARSAHSIKALKAYLRGEAALGAGNYAEAADEFRRATTDDSTFALAYYRWSIAADWVGRASASDRAKDLAIRYSDQLDDKERRLLYGYAAWRDGRGAFAESAFRDLVADYPDDTEAWFQLGEVLFHDNPLRGESVTEARPVFERVVELAPDNVEAIMHLARIAALEGREADASALASRATRLVSDPAKLERRTARMFALANRLATNTDTTSPASRAFALRMRANASLARGDWPGARAQLDSAIALDEGLSLLQLARSATLPFVPASKAELESIRARLAAWSPDRDTSVATGDADGIGATALSRLHALGLLSVRIGDRDGARRAAATLDAFTSPARVRRAAHTLAQSIRAHLADSDGHLLEALGDIESADWEGPAHVFAEEAGDRYFRATLLARSGRTNEALRWFRSMAERADYELPFLQPARDEIRRIER
jgi:DNA-binding SARP family transcriptional activator/tetratricopeptide (TPR) repeat protein